MWARPRLRKLALKSIDCVSGAMKISPVEKICTGIDATEGKR
jgi:hypothetical protein